MPKFDELPNPTHNRRPVRMLPAFALQLTQRPEDIEYVSQIMPLENAKLKQVYQPNPMRYFAPQKRANGAPQYFHVAPFEPQEIIEFQQQQNVQNIETVMKSVNLLTEKRIHAREELQKKQLQKNSVPREVVPIRTKITIPSYFDTTEQVVEQFKADVEQPRLKIEKDNPELHQATQPSNALSEQGNMMRGNVVDQAEAGLRQFLIAQFQKEQSAYKNKVSEIRQVVDTDQQVQIDASQIHVPDNYSAITQKAQLQQNDPESPFYGQGMQYQPYVAPGNSQEQQNIQKLLSNQMQQFNTIEAQNYQQQQQLLQQQQQQQQQLLLQQQQLEQQRKQLEQQQQQFALQQQQFMKQQQEILQRQMQYQMHPVSTQSVQFQTASSQQSQPPSINIVSEPVKIQQNQYGSTDQHTGETNLATQLNQPNIAAMQQLLAQPAQNQFTTVQIDASTVPLQQNNAFRPPSELSIQLEDDGVVLSASASTRDTQAVANNQQNQGEPEPIKIPVRQPSDAPQVHIGSEIGASSVFGQKTVVADEKPPQAPQKPRVPVAKSSDSSDSDEFDLNDKPAVKTEQPAQKQAHPEAHKKKKRALRQKPKLQVDSSLSDSFLDKMGKTDFKKKAQEIIDDDSLFDD